MLQTRVHFGIGFSVGICITALFFHFFAPRYEVTESNRVIIRQDKWSGTSWKYEGDEWKEIKENRVNWKPVDSALMKALNVPVIEGKKKSNNQIIALKKKYPFLEEFSDEDIMERIKYIYARKIMLDLYFSKANLE
jgi:hypothetical protein